MSEEEKRLLEEERPGIEREDRSFAEAIKIPLKTVNKDNYLGDQQTVQFLVRNFAAHALARRGTIGDDEATKLDVNDSKTLARIFLGQDPAYPAIEDWNTVGQIDEWIAGATNVVGTPEEVVSSALIDFLVSIYKLYNQAVFGGLDENVDWQVGASCEDTTKLLLGIMDANYTEEDLAAMQEE